MPCIRRPGDQKALAHARPRGNRYVLPRERCALRKITVGQDFNFFPFNLRGMKPLGAQEYAGEHCRQEPSRHYCALSSSCESFLIGVVEKAPER